MLLASRCRWLAAPGRWAVRARIERFVEPVVLLVLAAGPCHGYDLKERLVAQVGEESLDVANLYRLLRQLELEGLVRSNWHTAGTGPARRVYRLTSAGRRLLDQWAEQIGELGGTISAFRSAYDSIPTRARS